MHEVNYFSHNWLAIKLNNEILQNQLESGNIKGVVYDLGCGERPYEKDILGIAEDYVGVDWGNTLHDLKADIVSNLNEKLPIASEVADTVISFQVLEHLCCPSNFLSEVHRILKTGGMVIVTVPFQWWVHEAPYDYFRYTPFGLKKLLENAGFQNVKVKPTSGFFTMWILKLNYFMARSVQVENKRWLRKLFVPIWFFGQMLAPHLDRMDKQWELETASYVAVAKKQAI